MRVGSQSVDVDQVFAGKRHCEHGMLKRDRVSAQISQVNFDQLRRQHTCRMANCDKRVLDVGNNCDY